MEITLEKQDSINATIKVNLKEADYQPKVKEKLKEYGKKAQIKGFRPGKVPVGLIQKMYGKSILVDEINHLLVDTLNSYIKENNLPIIGDPLPDTQKAETIDWDNQKDFVFNYNVGLIPDFQYDLNNLNLSKYKIDITPQIVQETLDNLTNQFGNQEDVEQIGNDETVVANVKLENIQKEVTLILSKSTNTGKAAFSGKKTGDVVEVEVSSLFEDPAVLAHAFSVSVDEAKNLQGEASFTINKITKSVKAELNQEFFDKIFGKDKVTTLEEFNEKLTQTIAENYERETEFLLKRDIQNAIVQNTQIDLPNEFLKRWLLVTNQGKITEEQIEKEYEFYLKELKWSLIRNKIAKDNDIKVENAEVVDKSKEMIKQQFGGMDFGPEMEETLNNIANNYLQQEKGNNYYKLYEEIMVDKIITVISEKAPLTEKKVSLDEFKQLV